MQPGRGCQRYDARQCRSVSLGGLTSGKVLGEALAGVPAWSASARRPLGLHLQQLLPLRGSENLRDLLHHLDPVVELRGVGAVEPPSGCRWPGDPGCPPAARRAASVRRRGIAAPGSPPCRPSSASARICSRCASVRSSWWTMAIIPGPPGPPGPPRPSAPRPGTPGRCPCPCASSESAPTESASTAAIAIRRVIKAS